jgi:hypothetical protein
MMVNKKPTHIVNTWASPTSPHLTKYLPISLQFAHRVAAKAALVWSTSQKNLAHCTSFGGMKVTINNISLYYENNLL